MLGSIIGDIAGSTYEFNNIKTKDFPFFAPGSVYTDDSILTIATADWILHGGQPAKYYSDYASEYPNPEGGYGTSFKSWVIRSQRLGDTRPYNSCGNGSAMRVGPVGWAFDTIEEVMREARTSAACTHNHPEGIKGAQATAVCILLARQGATKDAIKQKIEEVFGYDLSLTIDEIRPRYSWTGLDGIIDGATCQGSVPQAIRAFLDGKDFEDSIRNAVSIGGDSDTIACITGSIAEAFFGIPQELRVQAMNLLRPRFKDTVRLFEEKYGCGSVLAL
ncbi:MAG: ADP-ribosylglycohydrolase family protein [Muribaculaceae bacterium]|nr:ADP-ribosylglycohydrolase family protein [Muribaculaceae bacterium]